jgi:hypothetical protein
MKRLLLLLILFATAAHAAPPFMVVPIYPTSEAQVTSFPANTMACGRFVMPTTILGATKLAVNVTTGYGAGKKVGFAIYPDVDGGPAIATSGSVGGAGVAPEIAGIVKATGLTAFDLTGSVTYRACFCASGTAGAYAGPKWVSGTGFAHLQNAFVVSVGSTTNACDANATPPATTGALVGNETFAPPLMMVSSE